MQRLLVLLGLAVVALVVLAGSWQALRPAEGEWATVDVGQVTPAQAPRTVDPARPHLRVALGAMVSPRDTYEIYSRLLAHIGSLAGADIEFVQRKTYAEVNEMLHRGELDLAFVCSGPYALGRDTYGFDLLASPEVQGSSQYRSYLITRNTSELHTLHDLQRYARSLEDALTAQARTVAQNLSAQLADLVLTNDLAGVQRLLDRQTGDANVGYAFVLKGGSILAHTFDGEVPTDLLALNSAPAGDRGSVRKVRFSSGPAYLDVAWPIFEGRAGELRLGFSERQRSEQISRLWLETASITLAILAVALTAGMLFLRRVTRPFATLVTAIREIGQGNLNVRVDAEGQAEIALVADAFNTITARLEQYTRQIEENAAALQRLHSQIRIANEIVLGVAGLDSLQDAGEFLLQRIREMLRCRDVALLFFESWQQAVFVVSDEGIGVVRGAEVVEQAVHALEGCDRVTHFAEPVFAPPLVPESIARRPRQMVMPLLHEQQISGALVAGCKGECACSSEEMGVAGLVLGQAAGSIRRVLHYEEELRDLRMRLDGTAGFI
jgi:HAMP domain-containing protein